MNKEVSKSVYGKYDPRNLSPEQWKSIRSYIKDAGGNIVDSSPYAVGVGIAADTLLGDDRLDRKGINLAGNAIGAAIGSKYGPAGKAIGAMAGGWMSDRIANIFDEDDGRNSNDNTNSNTNEMLNTHLSKDPAMQIAIYQEQLRQARLRQKEMERQIMQMAAIQEQSEQMQYQEPIQRSYGSSFGTMVNPYDNVEIF